MYLSRLTFHTLPGKTGEVERELQKLSASIWSTIRNWPKRPMSRLR